MKGLKELLEISRKKELKRIKDARVLSKRIWVLIQWGFNIEDANSKSIMVWYDGSNYIITKIFQTKEETLEEAVKLNLSEYAI